MRLCDDVDNNGITEEDQLKIDNNLAEEKEAKDFKAKDRGNKNEIVEIYENKFNHNSKSNYTRYFKTGTTAN